MFLHDLLLSFSVPSDYSAGLFHLLSLGTVERGRDRRDRRSKGIRLGTGKERESAALAGDILLDLGNPL
jgi:hypothetical protein